LVGIVKFCKELFVFEVPNFDGILGSNAEPIFIGAEGESIDKSFSVKAGKLLALVEVPEESISVLSTGSTERTVRGNSNMINITSMPIKLPREFPVRVPDFDELIKSAGDNGAVL